MRFMTEKFCIHGPFHIDLPAIQLNPTSWKLVVNLSNFNGIFYISFKFTAQFFIYHKEISMKLHLYHGFLINHPWLFLLIFSDTMFLIFFLLTLGTEPRTLASYISCSNHYTIYFFL